jgi:hypothetical protein
MIFQKSVPLYQTTRCQKHHFHATHEGSMIFQQAAPLYQTSRCHKTEDTIWIIVSVSWFNIREVLFYFFSLCYKFLISISLHGTSYYYFFFGSFFLYFISPTLHLHLYCSQFFSFLLLLLLLCMFQGTHSKIKINEVHNFLKRAAAQGTHNRILFCAHPGG